MKLNRLSVIVLVTLCGLLISCIAVNQEDELVPEQSIVSLNENNDEYKEDDQEIIVETESVGEESDEVEENNETGGVLVGKAPEGAKVQLINEEGVNIAAVIDKEGEYTIEQLRPGDYILRIEVGTQITEQSVRIDENTYTNVNPYGSTQKMDNSLEVRVYPLDVDMYKINALYSSNGNFDYSDPYLNTITVENISEEHTGNVFYSKEINVPTRDFSEGFPGVSDAIEWFGIRYNGAIVPEESGEYQFRITSDDGVKVTLDDMVIIGGGNVGNIHAPVSYDTTLLLLKGKPYNLEVEYFQGPRHSICLVLEVKKPSDNDYKIFSMNDFSNEITDNSSEELVVIKSGKEISLPVIFDFEEETSGWFSRTGNESVMVADNGFENSNSLRVFNRSQNYEGVMFPVSNVFISGENYIIEAYVFQDSGDTVDILLSLEKNEGRVTYTKLAVAKAESGIWTKLSVTYSCEFSYYTPGAYLYFETGTGSMDFYVDRVSIERK